MEELRREQNELNDILIKRDGAGGGKLKNVLLMTAALLLIVIIGILAFRIIETGTTDVQREVKPIDETPAVPAVEEPKTLFDAAQAPAPEADQARKTLDEMIQRHREAREKEMGAETPATTEADKQLPPVPMPPVEQKAMTPEPVKDVKEAKAPKAEEKKPAVTKVEPAKTEPKAEAKPVTKTQPKAAAGHYFVQVESLSKEPRADYIKLLKNKGFNVVVKDKKVDGKSINRIYVGPYTTKEEAAAVLPKIKRDFNPEAFIIQD